ncbi:hypothetical protein BGX27_010277 [Mortierella sp. AM989]|nr:hypothetical protein BGX27_010277 [Mortierella sp. AM989]
MAVQSTHFAPHEILDAQPNNNLENSVNDISLEEADENILNCLERIERNAGVRGGKPTVVRALSALNPVIHSFGLSPEQLTQLLDIILVGKLDDTTTRKLIKLMLPRQHVPEDCAIKVLGCLGRQLAFPSQREDVKPFRIRKLMDLQITVGKEPAIIGLLHVYKSFSPDLILTPLTLSNHTVFKCPDQVTSALIMELQEKWSHLGTSHTNGQSLNGSKEPIMKSGIKRKNFSQYSVPDASSIYRKGDSNKALPLSQITSLDSLVEHIDTLALPDQLSSVLSNRLLQHVLCLQPSHSIVERISYWLGQELMDLWYWREKTDATRTKFTIILSKVVEVTTMIKITDHEMCGMASSTRRRYLLYSPTYGPAAMKLLQRWAQFKWKDYIELGKTPLLSKKGVEGLRRLFSELAPNVDYMKTIRAFIGHVDNISAVALEIEHDHIAVQHGVLSFFDLASTLTGSYNLPLAVVIPDSTIVYRCFLSDSGMSISRVCGIIYQYKQAFEAFEQEQQLQYDLLVQSQMSSQDMASNGQDAPPAPAPLEVPGYSREYVILFNSFVMDICNFLWRNRAFNRTDKNAQGFLMGQPTTAHVKQVCVDAGLSMNNMLSMTHSIALSGYSARFLKSLEVQQNVSLEKRLKAPASTPALKDMVAKGGLNMSFDDYRIQYLDYLEQKGFEGISQFLFDCITNLLQRRLQNLERQREQKESNT